MTSNDSAPLTPETPSDGADAVVPATPKRPKEPQQSAKGTKPGSLVGWSGVLVAVVALAMQAFLLNFVVVSGADGGASLSYNPPGLFWDQNNVLVSLVLLVVLLAAAAAAVIGVVALFGKGKPRWISWVTIGVGLTVLIGTLSFWQGVATLP